MCARPLIAILPKPLSYGDEIIIKGKVRQNANEVSFNFALDCSPQPSHIAYHFKTLFGDNRVVHNYKDNNYWMEESTEDNTWIDGPGEDFLLTFYFDDTEILVYTGDDMRDFQYRFEHMLPKEQIRSVQVWGDVEHINEVTFRFKVDE